MILFEDRESPTRITITLNEASEGGISLTGEDSGDAPRRHFGHDDYEYGLSIAADAIRPLAIALLSEKYAGDASAVSHLQEFCREHDIPCSFWTY